METKKLSVTNLMIGDWVNIYKFTNEEQQIKDLFPAKVVSILQGNEKENFNTVECIYGKIIASRPVDTCLPIPLTAEVLEKNNFEKHYDDDIIIYTHPQGVIIEMGINYKFFDDGHFFVRGLSHRLYFIHQLQQALRLLNIDKEIVL